MKTISLAGALLLPLLLIAAVGGNDTPNRDPWAALEPSFVSIGRPVDAGFFMGSDAGEVYRDATIEELIRVHLSYGWRVTPTEITRAQYKALMKEDRSIFGRCDDCPVNNVSWYDATEFLDEWSRRDGLQQCYGGCAAACGEGNTLEWSCFRDCRASAPAILECTGYRLPTAAEFEYMSRAGPNLGPGLTAPADGRGVDSCDAGGGIEGEAWFCPTANNDVAPRPIAGDCADLIAGVCVRTHKVATKAANALGVYDIKGNVYEWVHDLYCATRTDTTNPTGDGCNDIPSVEKRGGSLKEPLKHQRPAQRSSDDPTRRQWNIGFRAVLNGAG